MANVLLMSMNPILMTPNSLLRICSTLLLTAVLAGTALAADKSCTRVNAYWETNLTKLAENLSECTFQSWQKCSQAAAIHYDLNAGSLFHRAKSCGLSKPTAPGADYTDHQASDSQQCTNARDKLRKVFEDRAQARLACAAARAGGDDQEWLDAQCSYFRSQMANYHTPFLKMTQSCEFNYRETVALKD